MAVPRVRSRGGHAAGSLTLCRWFRFAFDALSHGPQGRAALGLLRRHRLAAISLPRDLHFRLVHLAFEVIVMLVADDDKRERPLVKSCAGTRLSGSCLPCRLLYHSLLESTMNSTASMPGA